MPTNTVNWQVLLLIKCSFGRVSEIFVDRLTVVHNIELKVEICNIKVEI